MTGIVSHLQPKASIGGRGKSIISLEWSHQDMVKWELWISFALLKSYFIWLTCVVEFRYSQRYISFDEGSKKMY